MNYLSMASGSSSTTYFPRPTFSRQLFFMFYEGIPKRYTDEQISTCRNYSFQFENQKTSEIGLKKKKLRLHKKNRINNVSK